MLRLAKGSIKVAPQLCATKYDAHKLYPDCILLICIMYNDIGKNKMQINRRICGNCNVYHLRFCCQMYCTKTFDE